MQKRILFPTDTGWRIRTRDILRHLATRHDITYLCNVQDDDIPRLDEMHALGVSMETVPWREVPKGSVRFYLDLAANLRSPWPFTVAKDDHAGLRQRARALLESAPYDLVVCDFVHMAVNLRGLPLPATLLFQHNVEAMILRRLTDLEPAPIRRLYFRHQWRKMRRYEERAGASFDLVVSVSPFDRAVFERDYGWRHVRLIDTGVDLTYFAPTGSPATERRVVFVGSLDWLPNQDGLRFFVAEVWPMVRARCAGAVFDIVGRRPPPAIHALARIPGVNVIGTVRDVRPYLDRAAVVVVPLRAAGGTRLKVYEALAMRRAVVSTTVGIEGLAVEPDVHLAVADDPTTFARTVVALLESSTRRDELADAGHALVRNNYSSEVVADQFDACCREAVKRRRAGRPDCRATGHEWTRA